MSGPTTQPTAEPSVLSGEARAAMRDELARQLDPARGRGWRRLGRWLLTLWWGLLVEVTLAAKRVVESLISLLLLLLSAPLTLPLAATLWLWRGRALERRTMAGRFCVPFERLSFAVGERSPWRWLGVAGIPVLINVLRGEMALVGPRCVTPGELSPRQRAARARYNVRPGLVCLWWVRRRANIAYGDEASADEEYVAERSLLGDAGIALRAIPALLYGEGVQTAPDELSILGLRIDNLTMAQAIDRLCDAAAAEPRQPLQACFVNADCGNIACRDAAYRAVVQRADLVLADGIGFKLAGRMLGRDIRENVNGTDMFPLLCAAMAERGLRLYLLGARPGVTDAVAAWLAEHHPRLQLAGHRDGYFDADELPAVIAGVREARADLLLVALGAPAQDLWVAEHLGATGVGVGVGVGGLFDFYSGRITRAPVWMREMGMEWFYRFLMEPRRMWRRYFVGNGLFLGRVLLERVGLWIPERAPREAS